ncbi:protein kinase-like protein [Xylariomycetidae sp. FL2044]|nr:protein kinase-like protein [Xylariomycetidae sp. FL2044]
MSPSDCSFPSSWSTFTDDVVEKTGGKVNWEGLVKYASDIKSRRDGNGNGNEDGGSTECQLSSQYHMGGRNLVRGLRFRDGTCWVARVQLHKHTPKSFQRLSSEVHTMTVLRAQTKIPVPEVYAYEANCDNVAAVPFVLMEFIPGDTAMDSFGGWREHRGVVPTQYQAKLDAAMADIQVQMSSIRFSQIGSITKLPDGTYSVGPLPGLGGPFDSAAEFFVAWASSVKYPLREERVRERTPAQYIEQILQSINSFPTKLKDLASVYKFRDGPFPLFHTDLYISNIIIDPQYNILSVIDWEDAFVVPWEMLEFSKDLSIVPPIMDGPLYQEDEETRRQARQRAEYVRLASTAERDRGLDNVVSTVLGDNTVQYLAHALWLYKDGRIGFYGDLLDKIKAGHGF